MTRRRNLMKRVAAEIRAMDRWTTADRSRVGRAWRRCNAALPCEVGFESQCGPRGGWANVVCGKGRTWEDAFADADSYERRP